MVQHLERFKSFLMDIIFKENHLRRTFMDTNKTGGDVSADMMDHLIQLRNCPMPSTRNPTLPSKHQSFGGIIHDLGVPEHSPESFSLEAQKLLFPKL